MTSVITKTEPDMTACDNMLQDSCAEEDSTRIEIQSTSIPAAINDKAQESPKAFTDLDYFDGPTVIAEVYPLFHAHLSCSLGCGSYPGHTRQKTTVRRLE